MQNNEIYNNQLTKLKSIDSLQEIIKNLLTALGDDEENIELQMNFIRNCVLNSMIEEILLEGELSKDEIKLPNSKDHIIFRCIDEIYINPYLDNKEITNLRFQIWKIYIELNKIEKKIIGFGGGIINDFVSNFSQIGIDYDLNTLNYNKYAHDIYNKLLEKNEKIKLFEGLECGENINKDKIIKIFMLQIKLNLIISNKYSNISDEDDTIYYYKYLELLLKGKIEEIPNIYEIYLTPYNNFII